MARRIVIFADGTGNTVARYTGSRLSPPLFSPADLIQVRCVFDDPGFIYGLKHDGFGHPVIPSKYLDGSPGFGD